MIQTNRALRAFLPALAQTIARIARRNPSADLPSEPETPLETLVDIPIREGEAGSKAAQQARDRGLFLARQDRWDDLAAEIRAADSARATAPGGVPLAELLAYGARCDVVEAVEQALERGAGAEYPALLSGIMSLEAMRQEHRTDPHVTLVVALAHIDIAWAWRGTGAEASLPALNRQRCAAHFDRAARLLEGVDASALDSPAVASAQCALWARRPELGHRLADRYGALVDLDPHNFRAMRALGAHLLPDHAALDLEARRTAARTQQIWGAGGYAWVCFDAIAQDPAACDTVDADFFIDGLRDIVAAHPEQEMINLLAAYCAITLRRDGDAAAPDSPRARIAACAGWLIRDHLTEVHPLLWAHAAQGFDNNARVTSPQRFAARGRADALCAIAEQFRDDLDRGLRITFTPEGPVTSAL